MTGITLTQMQHVLTTEAERKGIVQQALIDARIRKLADPGYMQIKATLEAAARLVAMVESDPVMLKRLQERVRDAKRAAAEQSSQRAAQAAGEASS